VDEIMLFTDGSVNVQSKIGYGAYLAVFGQGLSFDSLKKLVKVKRFEQTSSTKLELQSLLWALNEIKPIDNKVIIFTDSQNIIGLPERRGLLEKNEYRSKKNKLIKNYQLYQEFYQLADQLNCEMIKVQGHLPSSQKNYIQRLFAIVDKASRKAIKEHS